MLATLMAMTALGIDMMLPSFGAIRQQFGLSPTSTEVSAVVTVYLLGLALAQMIHGPLSDRFGRKPVLWLGLSLYLAGAAGSALSTSLPMLLVARFLWGVGAAGPRVVTVAAIRDRFSGEAMAKTLSLVMAIFVLVPVIAPSLGTLLLAVGSWRWVFAFGVVYALVAGTWARRLPETLAPEHRRSLELARLRQAVSIVVRNRITFGYTLALTLLFGAFSSYLASSQLIITEFLGHPDAFPFVFGGLAAVMGVAMLVNGSVVDKVGLHRLAHVMMVVFTVAGVAAVTVFALRPGLGLVAFAVAMAVLMGSYALIFPNLNTIAMDPMGEVAGMAAAVIGTVSLGGGALLGSVIDASFTDGPLPLFVGFAGYGVLAMLTVLWVERGRLTLRRRRLSQPVLG